ncbi:MAG: alanine racemase [Parachlamydiales bacterium]|nr:alanine racemase [Parachlamydiales bacterium]
MQTAHPTWIEINLAQFCQNIEIVRSMIGKSRFCLPVKANAYGHGLIGIGKAAQDAGVDCLGVSCLQEGAQLRNAGVAIPILVFGAIHEDQIEDLVRYDLEFSISSKFKADLVAKKLSGKCRVHLEVETGMQRTGVRPETAIHLAQHLKHLPSFDLVGVYSHMATADRPDDPFAQSQIASFKKLASHPVFHGVLAHLANSGGVIHYPESHLDMVRPGLMVYGYPPAPVEGLEPCFSLKSKISYFKVVEADAGIGYGHQYRTRKQTRIVTVPIGYGDGYRRALSNRGCVLIRGKRYPIAGNICMDQFMVDIGNDEAYVGDEVVLIGKQEDEEIKLTELAALCDTIPYEVLCLFNQRIPRIFS